ncbi:MAG: polysaccharide deacetylase family protein [Armatimonadota bacterium]
MENRINDSQQNINTETPVRWGIPLAGWLVSSLLAAWLYVAVAHPDLRFWDGVFTHGNPQRRAVALTFDDGPHPLWAPLLADSLERHGAKGTFFLVGMEAQCYPELTARLARAGHEVGNHSMNHPYPNLTALSPQGQAREILDAATLLEQFTGQPVVAFRPPGGGIDDALLRLARKHGMSIAWWSRNIGDWGDIPPEVIAARLRDNLRPGAVMLLHQREHTVAGVEAFLAGSGGAGYTYNTFTELMRH